MSDDYQNFLFQAMGAQAPEALRPEKPAVACDCGQRLDEFLRVLHEELQADEKTRTVLMADLGRRGKFSLHWSRPAS